jgi:hypothetical protein
MGHVRDVNLKFVIAALYLPDGNSVVKVAGGFAINGDNGEIAGVASLLGLGRRDDRLNILRFVEDFWRKMMRQVKFTDDDFYVDPEVVFITQNFDYASSRILSGRRPVCDFYVDDYAFEIIPFGAAGSLVTENAVD